MVTFCGGVSATASDLAGLLTPVTLIALAAGILASAGAFTRLTSDWRDRQWRTKGVHNTSVESLRLEADGALVLAIRFVLLAAVAIVACGRIAAGTYSPFIYFRF